MREKLLSLPDLLAALRARRAKGERVVLTNGCFDLLHVGHVRYLQAARTLGDILVVGVNADASVRSIKEPGRPFVPELDRAELVAALEAVDYVVLFSEPTAGKLVMEIRPDMYVKGGDYREEELPETPVVRTIGGRVQILEFVPGHSTSELIRRIRSVR
jgi:rfaE bifunctional protein nucleotidyltransferase chain/domain